MKRIKTLLACLIMLGINLPSAAAADPAQYRLTSETLRKLEAVDQEAKKIAAASKKARGKEEEEEAEEAEDQDDQDDQEDEQADKAGGKSDRDDSVEGIARKIDADPRLKALLAKHGLSSMDYALMAHAMLHAGMYLMFEGSMPKPKAAELYNGYTKAQQANIEMLRNSAVLKK